MVSELVKGSRLPHETITKQTFNPPPMKKQLLLAAAVLVTTVGFAQESAYLIDSQDEFTWTGSAWSKHTSTTYMYSPYLELEASEEQTLQNGIWVNSDRFDYHFDENDLLTSRIQEKWFNNSWTNYEFVRTSYTEADKPEIEVTAKWTSNTWKDLLRTIRTYDSEDRETAISNEKLLGGNWVSETETIKTYDNAGNLETTEESHFVLDHWEPLLNNRYTYDNGHIDSLIQSSWQDTVWRPTRLWVHQFDNTGFLLRKSGFQMTNGSWELFDRMTYSHDNKGKVKEEVYESHDGNSFQNHSRSTFKFMQFVSTDDLTKAASGIKAFPVPAKDVLYVDSEHPNGQLSLINLQGQVVLNQPLRQGQQAISVNHLSHGVYLLQTQVGNAALRHQRVVIGQ